MQCRAIAACSPRRPTQCCTREPLPRHGETDEGRPHRGAGGGPDARAHRRLSLSPDASVYRCERDHDTTLSQHRLVNTNRPRSRDKIFDLHFITHTSTLADRVATNSTHAQVANCSCCGRQRRAAAAAAAAVAALPPPPPAPAGVLHLTIFPEN